MVSFRFLMRHWQDKETSLNTLLKGTYKASLVWHTRRPAFFTPYKNFSDAAFDVVFPFVGPIVLGLIAVVAGIVAAVSTVIFAVSFLLAKGLSFFNDELAVDIMDIGAVTALVSTAVSLLFAINAIVSGPVTALSFVTRMEATVANQLGCYEPESAEQENISLVPSY